MQKYVCNINLANLVPLPLVLEYSEYNTAQSLLRPYPAHLSIVNYRRASPLPQLPVVFPKK